MRIDVIQRVTEYWSERRGGRRLPAYDTLDFDALADILAHVVLAEAVDGGRDYLHVVAGPEAEKLLGAAMEGERLSQLARSENALAAWRNGLNIARVFRAPHFAVFEGVAHGPGVRAVFLPVGNGGEAREAGYVLAGLAPDDRDAAPED